MLFHYAGVQRKYTHNNQLNSRVIIFDGGVRAAVPHLFVCNARCSLPSSSSSSSSSHYCDLQRKKVDDATRKRTQNASLCYLLVLLSLFVFSMCTRRGRRDRMRMHHSHRSLSASASHCRRPSSLLFSPSTCLPSSCAAHCALASQSRNCAKNVWRTMKTGKEGKERTMKLD